MPEECTGSLVSYGGEYGDVFEHPYPDDGHDCPVCGPTLREFDAEDERERAS